LEGVTVSFRQFVNVTPESEFGIIPKRDVSDYVEKKLKYVKCKVN
jgi:hypothetical protein